MVPLLRDYNHRPDDRSAAALVYSVHEEDYQVLDKGTSAGGWRRWYIFRKRDSDRSTRDMNSLDNWNHGKFITVDRRRSH